MAVRTIRSCSGTPQAQNCAELSALTIRAVQQSTHRNSRYDSDRFVIESAEVVSIARTRPEPVLWRREYFRRSARGARHFSTATTCRRNESSSFGLMSPNERAGVRGRAASWIDQFKLGWERPAAAYTREWIQQLHGGAVSRVTSVDVAAGRRVQITSSSTRALSARASRLLFSKREGAVRRTAFKTLANVRRESP